MNLFTTPTLFGNSITGIEWPTSRTFTSTLQPPCPHCSGNGSSIWHGGICPKIKSIEYHRDGSIKHIEFK